MAENPIDLIREAEISAEESVKAAGREVNRIIDRAQKDAFDLQVKAESDAKRKAASDLEAAHRESRLKVEAAMSDLSGEIEALKKSAAAHRSKAIKLILDALA